MREQLNSHHADNLDCKQRWTSSASASSPIEKDDCGEAVSLSRRVLNGRGFWLSRPHRAVDHAYLKWQCCYGDEIKMAWKLTCCVFSEAQGAIRPIRNPAVPLSSWTGGSRRDVETVPMKALSSKYYIRRETKIERERVRERDNRRRKWGLKCQISHILGYITGHKHAVAAIKSYTMSKGNKRDKETWKCTTN